MNKIKQTDVFFPFLNGYLIYAIISIFTQQQYGLYGNLDNDFSFLMVIISCSVITGGLFLFEKLFKLEAWRERLFIILFMLFFNIFAFKSKSMMVTLGSMLVLFVAYLYRRLNQKRYGDIYLLGIILLMLMAIYFMFNPSEVAIAEKFLVELTKNDKNSLMVILSSSVLLGALLFFKNKLRWLEKFKKHLPLVTGMIFVLQIILLSTIMIAKVKIFETPTFDMGIFTQMFANMKKGAGPVTTLERDRLLSHFSVHFSPIHYLLLPIYSIFPYAETLEVSQIILVASGVVPVYLIAKRLSFSQTFTYLLLLVYLLFPSLTTGHLYDYHENCFLAPMLLWLFYAVLIENKVLIVLFTILTLIIKEDATIYILSLGIYFLFQQSFNFTKSTKWAIAIVCLLLPSIYFVSVIHYLETVGTGAMTSRFANFMIGDQEGLKFAVMNALKNPVYTIASVFTYRKTIYLATLLFSLGLLPLFQKHLINYVLLLPLLVINLLSDWPYQVDLFKQYHYGSSTLLFLLLMIAVYEMLKDQRKRLSLTAKRLLVFAIIVSSGLQVRLVLPKMDKWQTYQENQVHYEGIKTTLANIPATAKVASLSNYTTALADRHEVYDLFYHKNGEVDHELDYIVFEYNLLNDSSKEAKIVNQYMEQGYVSSELSSDFILILEKAAQPVNQE